MANFNPRQNCETPEETTSLGDIFNKDSEKCSDNILDNVGALPDSKAESKPCEVKGENSQAGKNDDRKVVPGEDKCKIEENTFNKDSEKCSDNILDNVGALSDGEAESKPCKGKGENLQADKNDNRKVVPCDDKCEIEENIFNKDSEKCSDDNTLDNVGALSVSEAESKPCEGKGENLQADKYSNRKVVPSEDKSKREENAENIHYEGDVCVYTDPETKFQYTWNSEKDEWTPRYPDSATLENNCAVENNGNIPREGGDISKDYTFDGETYTYVDKNTGVTYRYDNISKKWIKKDSNLAKAEDSDSEYDSDSSEKKDNVIKQDMTAGHYSFDGDSHLYTDPKDGTVYFWDKEKNAWFPKIDDDFLAHYQMNYGFTEPSNPPEEKDKTEELKSLMEEKELKRKAAAKEPTWFEVDDDHNTKVYVSNLPLDITEEEFVGVMQKCGLILRDVDTGKMKVKIYTDPENEQPKGDALCTYMKIESVYLALKLLDGYDVRGKKLRVERAQFQMKGDYDPKLKPKKRRRKDKEKLKKMQEKLFDWRPDKLRGERSKHERVVIVKNLFEPQTFEKEVALILEYQQDLREECSKCGDVRKVVVYDRNPEGVAQITFREAEEADLCIQLLNGRWFGQRKITAETWDGKTKYKIVETEEETKKRLQQWNKYLEGEAGNLAKGKTDQKEILEANEKNKSDNPFELLTEQMEVSDEHITQTKEEPKIPDSGKNESTSKGLEDEPKITDSGKNESSSSESLENNTT